VFFDQQGTKNPRQTEKNFDLPPSKTQKKILSNFSIMKSSPLFILSALFVVCFLVSLVASASSPSLPQCGYILDGSVALTDIDRQSDHHQIRANWYGFHGVQPFASTGAGTGTTGNFPPPLGTSGTSGGSTGKTTGNTDDLKYQVAIVSQYAASAVINSTGLRTPAAQRCRSNSGFKHADVQGFVTANPTWVQGPLGFPVQVWKSGPLNLTTGVEYYVVLKVTAPNGKTIYTNTDGVHIVANGTGSEDDDQFPPYKAGLIAMGIAICCLLVLLLLLILVAKGKGEDKYTTTVHRNENVDKL
jgi:hypothetical protein